MAPSRNYQSREEIEVKPGLNITMPFDRSNAGSVKLPRTESPTVTLLQRARGKSLMKNVIPRICGLLFNGRS